MKELQDILEKMEPEEALAALTLQIRKILSHFDEEAKMNFLADLIGKSEEDKISSMVHL